MRTKILCLGLAVAAPTLSCHDLDSFHPTDFDAGIFEAGIADASPGVDADADAALDAGEDASPSTFPGSCLEGVCAGCCTSAYECVAGNQSSACGAAGNPCEVCGAGAFASCVNGSCQ